MKYTIRGPEPMEYEAKLKIAMLVRLLKLKLITKKEYEIVEHKLKVDYRVQSDITA